MCGDSGGMRFHLAAAILLASLTAPAAAADRSFTVTGFERIRIEGPFRVKVATNVPPFARASGSPAALDGVSIDVQGRTLVVRRSAAAIGRGNGRSSRPVEIVVGTHDLSSAWVNGSGSVAIDRVRGLQFDLSVAGSGGASIGAVTSDRLNVAAGGSVSVRIAGKVEKMTATVRGTSTLDAAALTAKEATIGVEGASVAKITARDTAKVDARGPAMVELAGSPACTVRVDGPAEVSGCR